MKTSVTKKKKKIYFNDPQHEFMQTGAHTSIIAGGRRIGKSHGIAAPYIQRNFQSMPGSSGGIVGSTFQQLLTRTLPGTLTSLGRMGFIRDVHYFLGRKPPKSAGFAKPYIEPQSYDKVLSWYNGSIDYLISQDVTGSSNSLTLDYLSIDEAKLINFEKLKDETLPANGGFKGYFGDNPWLNSILIMSDMPTTKKGSWFLGYKEKMDPELIETIQAIVYEIWRVKKELKIKKTTYYLKYLNNLRNELSQLRSVAVYYREWSSIENIQVLGERYIKQMKRDLPPLVFQTSILCKRVTKLRSGFYPGLNEEVHYYSAYDNSYLDSLEYDLNKAQDESCLQDGDLDKNNPICIAFDYNANINWLIVGQQHGVEMRTLKSFYVKYERKLREVVDDFCKYYRYHNSKEVVYYYDNTALGSNYAVNDEDFAKTICIELERNGWRVTPIHIGNPIKHHEKHKIIHQGLRGQNGLLPRFNKDNNEPLLLALEQADVKVGSRGFQKDKSGEKLAESEEDRLEHRTDGTDAWDTLYIGMNFFPVGNTTHSVASYFG